ncbi:hypothetical protein GCM10010439_67780 [Actinocorallia aurantiaca]|uniref:Uncharacterized protein n=1 Tax=Actinocorallia aurantiaca TaxID=46204 RepID=A0ABP6H7W9_9ACTN
MHLGIPDGSVSAVIGSSLSTLENLPRELDHMFESHRTCRTATRPLPRLCPGGTGYGDDTAKVGAEDLIVLTMTKR